MLRCTAKRLFASVIATFSVTIQKVAFREVFFVNVVQRKNENCGAKHVTVKVLNSYHF